MSSSTTTTLYHIFEEIVDKLIEDRDAKAREMVREIVADYMEALGTVVLPEEVWLWIADINGKHLNKTLEGNI
jgi:hypothetical protein